MRADREPQLWCATAFSKDVQRAICGHEVQVAPTIQGGFALLPQGTRFYSRCNPAHELLVVNHGTR